MERSWNYLRTTKNELIMNYENIFRLDKKLVFVLGGSGYIGQEVVKVCVLIYTFNSKIQMWAHI